MGVRKNRTPKCDQTMAFINQFHPRVAKGDAITNELWAIKAGLIKAGYESDIYATYIQQEFKGLVKPIAHYEGNSNAVLLVHHSMGFPEDDFGRVRRLSDKKILIYHNITPTMFLSDPHLRLMSRIGREQLVGFRRNVHFAFADSEYSRTELIENGFRNTGVLPIIIDFNRYSVQPHEAILAKLEDYTNILFVGRMARNKRQEDLLKVFYYYHHYLNPKSNLILLHHLSFDVHYENQLKELASSLRLSGSVIFVATDSVKDLVTYYHAADLFLCMSEHEGFCVPLVESMYHHIPIIAYDSTAVPYTLSGAGILIKEKKHDDVAALIDLVLSDHELLRKIIDGQNRRLSELNPEKLMTQLLEVVNKTISGEYSVPQRDIEVAMITPWCANDGIAQYSRSLISNTLIADPALDFHIFASDTGGETKWEGNNVKRCWTPLEPPSTLMNAIARDDCQIVHVQFNLGFFRLQHLADIIKGVQDLGKKIIITFHSTAPVIVGNSVVDLQAYTDMFSKADLIMVHTKIDFDRLRRYGIPKPFIFPHGFPKPDPSIFTADPSVMSMIRGRPIIAMNGYILPHKGILETIRAIKILLYRYPSIILILACSLHHDPTSKAYYEQCRNEIRQLGLERNVTFITDMYATDEIIQLLSLADLVALPYKDTQESSSAAVRLPLAACRPVIVTDRTIFSEFSEEVLKIKDCTPAEIAKAITSILESEDLKGRLIEAATRRASRDSWKNVGGTYAQLLRELVAQSRQVSASAELLNRVTEAAIKP
jgi:glycosyltransferase involved in cell wall biosynthesis